MRPLRIQFLRIAVCPLCLSCHVAATLRSQCAMPWGRREGWDSNPRRRTSPAAVFETAPIVHSGTFPLTIIAHSHEKDKEVESKGVFQFGGRFCRARANGDPGERAVCHLRAILPAGGRATDSEINDRLQSANASTQVQEGEAHNGCFLSRIAFYEGL